MLYAIHSKGIVHINLKPSKFLQGKDKPYLHLIDFSQSVNIFKKKDYNYSQLVECNKFSSISVHKGEEVGPKDDLETLFYILVYFRTGGKWPPQLKGNSLKRSSNVLPNSKLQYLLNIKQDFIYE